jgi:hypothetical protein
MSVHQVGASAVIPVSQPIRSGRARTFGSPPPSCVPERTVRPFLVKACLHLAFRVEAPQALSASLRCRCRSSDRYRCDIPRDTIIASPRETTATRPVNRLSREQYLNRQDDPVEHLAKGSSERVLKGSPPTFLRWVGSRPHAPRHRVDDVGRAGSGGEVGQNAIPPRF